MEKFSTWRDKATGISPFMPQPFPISQKKPGKTSKTSTSTSFNFKFNFTNGFNKFILIIIRLPIFILKFPLFAITSILYSITGLRFLLSFTFYFLFGFQPIDFTVDGIKRSQVSKLEPFRPQRGDLIVTNYISPLDGFIMSLLTKGSSVVILIPDKNGILYKYTPWTLVNHCFGQVQGEIVGSNDELSKLRKRNAIFLLLEGTTSNNTAILPFIKLDPKYKFEDFQIKTLVMKLFPQYYTLPISNVASLYYLFELLTDLTSTKSVRCKIYKFQEGDDNKNNDDDGDDHALNSRGGLKLATLRKSFELNSLNAVGDELSVDAKNRFISYYFNHDVGK